MIFAFILPSEAIADAFCPVTCKLVKLVNLVNCHSLHLVSCVFLFVSPRVSPTPSPVCLSPSPPLTLCLSVFFQEEKGISCGLVDLDFLKCSVGFPFMRAQTKVAQTNIELMSELLNLSDWSTLHCCAEAFLHGIKCSILQQTYRILNVYCVSFSPVSFCSDFWHESALWGKWHIAVLSSSKKVTIKSLTF